MTIGSAWRALGRPIHPRFAVRWSTVLMLVAFVGLGDLYLQVRTTPVATITVPVRAGTPTTAPPGTTENPGPSSTSTEPPSPSIGTDTTVPTASSGPSTTGPTTGPTTSTTRPTQTTTTLPGGASSTTTSTTVAPP